MKSLCEQALLSVGGRARNESSINLIIVPVEGRDFPHIYILYTSAAHNSNNQIPAGGQFEKAAAVPIFSIRFFYVHRSLFSGALSFQEETAQSARPPALCLWRACVCVYTFMLDSICFCVPLQCSWMRLLYHSPLSSLPTSRAPYNLWCWRRIIKGVWEHQTLTLKRLCSRGKLSFQSTSCFGVAN